MTTHESSHRALSTASPTVAAGLEGIVVAETALSHVDGASGRLIIAGNEVDLLALSHDFEQVCDLLWAAAGVPAGASSAAELGKARTAAFARLDRLGDALHRTDAMDALRGALAQLPSGASAIDIVAATAVFVAAHGRIRDGKAPIAPDPTLGHAADLLHMLGLLADEPHAKALDAYLVTVSDHGLNASTFAARVVTSTGSDLVSSVVAGVGALKGPLHGGAPGPVLDMLDAIGKADQAETYILAALTRGERIMGMGHRIYRVRDPRALVLEQAIERLERSLTVGTSVRERLLLAHAAERAAERLLAERHPARALRANVEFYTAVLLEALGIARELFSAVFAVGRVLGWTAHVAEQRRTGRLIRPASRYVGLWPSEA